MPLCVPIFYHAQRDIWLTPHAREGLRFHHARERGTVHYANLDFSPWREVWREIPAKGKLLRGPARANLVSIRLQILYKTLGI